MKIFSKTTAFLPVLCTLFFGGKATSDPTCPAPSTLPKTITKGQVIEGWTVITLSEGYNKEGSVVLAHDAWIKDTNLLCNYIQGTNDSHPRVSLAMQMGNTDYVFEGNPHNPTPFTTVSCNSGGCKIHYISKNNQHCIIDTNTSSTFPIGCNFKVLKM
ncbi:MAG: hypothetical protein K2P93_00755 [Alphaproteobacteria bacterium]|nr:hypothetical protein [Alphaproteobacteria bacterium]